MRESIVCSNFFKCLLNLNMQARDMNSILFSLCRCCRVYGIRDNQEEEFVVPGVNEVVDILKLDYENAYFLTRTFIFHIFLSWFVVFLLSYFDLWVLPLVTNYWHSFISLVHSFVESSIFSVCVHSFISLVERSVSYQTKYIVVCVYEWVLV